MSSYTYEEVRDYVMRLDPEDQLELFKFLANILLPKVKIEAQHSLLELEGLGQEIWEGVDAQQYINEERDSWR